MTTPELPGLLVLGTAVLLTSTELIGALRTAVLVAARNRSINGLPASTTHRQLAEAIHQALTAGGHTDVPDIRYRRIMRGSNRP